MRPDAAYLHRPWLAGLRATTPPQDRHTAHPDMDWINSVLADLSGWLETPSPSPTSQITGGGAIVVAERMFSELHGSRPTLMMPSATYGMRATLAAFGVTAGSEVLVPALDWPSTYTAVRSLGAVPIPVAVDQDTLTIDPAAAATCLTPRTAAAVACHLHGIPADVPALRMALGDDIPIIEDAAQALGSKLDGMPVGSLGDAAVFSFGPGKTIDVGEAGIVVFRDWESHTNALKEVGHPVRQLLGGIERPEFGALAMRPHPLAAVLLVQRLQRWDPARDREYTRTLAVDIARLNEVRVLGQDPRRESAARSIPVRADRAPSAVNDFSFSRSGAHDISAIEASAPARALVHELPYQLMGRSIGAQTAGARE